MDYRAYLPSTALGNQPHWLNAGTSRKLSSNCMWQLRGLKTKCKSELYFYISIAGPGVHEIFKTYSAEVQGDNKEFDKAMKCLSDHFKVKKNVPPARQKLLASKPNPGETINNFVTCLKSLAEHCDYGEEEDNQVRDIVISHITNKELKGKFYREENLSLTRLLEIVSTYHPISSPEFLRLFVSGWSPVEALG